ncbi:DDE_Tnp_IS1595 domain-containing protein [Nephila pilipes]|uniref:DDE_Tnp_IS1595 domain-containing protein n=2 Tax=Nephila pilipes TaxID=299642 RepID=A0A8X6NCY1_NEPPI|nr:DDE_Tnp_IS1595 domain-containing protein [Nephila pilipes]
MDSVNSIPMTQLVKEYQQNVWQKVSVPRAFSSCRKDGALMGEPGVAKETSEIIGGVGKIVEIDESKFEKRKYNRGHRVEGQWVFGGVERGSGKLFLVAVHVRTKETLLSLIKEWIKPGTTIYSDCWKSYDCLADEDYEHLKNTVSGWAVLGKMNIKGNASHQFNSYQISFSCDNSIVYPHASSPASRDNSNVVGNNINSTYNDETLFKRPARVIDSSKNENSSGIEPAPIPSPKCALWYQNPKVIGLSSSHEKTDMLALQNFSEGASTSSCLFSSSGACASCTNTSIGDASFSLCLRFIIFGIKLTVSTTSVAASRNGGAVFERTIALLKQYNLEPDPD